MTDLFYLPEFFDMSRNGKNDLFNHGDTFLFSFICIKSFDNISNIVSLNCPPFKVKLKVCSWN